MDKKEVLVFISRIRSHANETIMRELEKRNFKGLVPSHGEILVNLFRHQRLSMKELAQKINRKKNTLTVLVDKLLDYGYVVKTPCPDDGRVYYISLTEKGKLFQKDFMEISEDILGKVYRGFSESEQEQLMGFLKRLNDNL